MFAAAVAVVGVNIALALIDIILPVGLDILIFIYACTAAVVERVPFTAYLFLIAIAACFGFAVYAAFHANVDGSIAFAMAGTDIFVGMVVGFGNSDVLGMGNGRAKEDGD